MIRSICVIPPSEFEGPTFTPEMLAATCARFSRNKEGLDAIKGICDKSKDPKKVFDFIDFGHSSIQELSGMIPIVFEDEAMAVIYFIFQSMYVYAAQESSTRYIDFEDSPILSAEEIGITGEESIEQYNITMSHAMQAYSAAKKEYEKLAEIVNFGIDLDQKKLDRLKRNFVFDKIRYFLPITIKTSAIILSTPREWCGVIKILNSTGIKLFERVADDITSELKKLVPNLVRHTEADFVSKLTYRRFISDEAFEIMTNFPSIDKEKCNVLLEGYEGDERKVDCDCKKCSEDYSKDKIIKMIEKDKQNKTQEIVSMVTEYRNNRYDVLDPILDSIAVGYRFIGVTVAENRDMIRHRSGGRIVSNTMNGLYLPDCNSLEMSAKSNKFKEEYRKLGTMLAMQGLHMFGMCLGTQCSIQRANTLRKAIYSCELRTGIGAHPGYRKFYLKLSEMIAKKYNAKMLIGTGEPEGI